MDQAESFRELSGGGSDLLSGAPDSEFSPSPSYLQAVLASITDQIFVVDQYGRHLYANAAGAAALQCAPEDVIGKTGAELGLPPPLVEMIADSCAHVLSSGETVREMAMRDAPDGPTELSFTFGPIAPMEDGRPKQVLVSIRAAAHEREAVETLWARVHQLHHIIDAAPTMIAYIDRGERYLFSNASYAAWFSKAPREIHGSPLREVISAALYDQSQVHIQAALSGSHVAFERQATAPDGDLRTLHCVYIPEFEPDGNIRGFVAVVTDITDRARITEALHHSEQQYRMLAETIPHIVWMTDGGGVMQYMSRRWTDYSGHVFRDASQLDEVHAFVLPEDQIKLAEAWRIALESSSSLRAEYRLRGVGGEYRWFLAQASPLIDERGIVTRWFGTSTDIHEEKQAAKEQAFLADLVDRLRRHHGDPEELLWQVVNAVGKYLGVSRCTYAEIDVARDLIYGYRDYHGGESVGVSGEYALSSFGPASLAALMSGETIANSDVAKSPLTAGAYTEAYTQIGIHAYVVIPLLKNGAPVSTLSILSGAPREWTNQEIKLLESVAERTWFAVENARLNRAAQEELLERRRAEEEIRRLNDELRSRAAQFEASYAREALLNRIGQAARVSSDPDVVQEKTLEALGQGMGVDRAFLSFVDSVHDVIRTGWDWRAEGLSSIAGEYALSAHAPVLDEIYAQSSTAAINDVRYAELTSVTLAGFQQAGTRAFISVPFFDGGVLIAFLTVTMSERARAWTRDEIGIVETAATQVRLAVEAARINQREHTIAATLQEALQPPIPSRVHGLDVGSYYKSALQESRIGGDFYDLFSMDDHTHALVVGDVSGKGLAAAAQVATVRNMLRCVLYGSRDRAIYGSGDLERAISSLNETLTARDLLSGFVTLFVGMYDADAGVLIYISCGHEPGLVRRGDGTLETLASLAPPLGISETSVYEAQTARLHPGDALVLYTDGISEAGPNRQDLLNTQGIMKMLNSAPTDTGAAGLVHHVITGVEDYAQGRQRDDICLMALIAQSTAS